MTLYKNNITNIAIRGAGTLGKIISNYFTDLDNYNVICYVDNSADKENAVVNGLPVVSVKQFIETYYYNTDKIVLAINLQSKDISEEVRFWSQYDKEIGLICKVEELLSGRMVREDNFFWIDAKKPFLSQLETNVTDNCNLNCKGCSHFCNTNDNYSAPSIDEFKNNLKLAANNVQILKMYLLGGEPLLNPELPEYIYSAREIMPDSDLRVVSNGMLVLKQSTELWKCFVETRTILEITEYPPTEKIINQIQDILNAQGVSYVIRGPIRSFIALIDPNGNNNAEVSQKNCLSSICRYLYKGKIYKCPISVLIEKYMNEFSLSVFPKAEGVTLNGSNDIKNELERLDIGTAMCNYCSSSPRTFEWKQQNKPSKEDWMK